MYPAAWMLMGLTDVAHASACRAETRLGAWCRKLLPKRRQERRRGTLKRAPHHLVGALALAAAALYAQNQEAEIRARLERAETAKSQGDFQTASAEYRKIIEIDPRNAEVHARLGMTYSRLGKLVESTQAFERALRLDPNLPRVNVLLAFNYM